MTVANAMRPSGEIARLPPAPYGLVTAATCGRRATRASTGAIRLAYGRIGDAPLLRVEDDLVDVAGLAGEVALEDVLRLCDSVSGSVKSVDARVPTADATALTTTSTATHRSSTRRRCSMHQRARRATAPSRCLGSIDA